MRCSCTLQRMVATCCTLQLDFARSLGMVASGYMGGVRYSGEPHWDPYNMGILQFEDYRRGSLMLVTAHQSLSSWPARPCAHDHINWKLPGGFTHFSYGFFSVRRGQREGKHNRNTTGLSLNALSLHPYTAGEARPHTVHFALFAKQNYHFSFSKPCEE